MSGELTTCPQCLKRQQDAQTRFRDRVSEKYGHIPEREYIDLLKEAEEPIHPRRLAQTAVERINVGVHPTDGFYIHYNIRCETCGFFYEYNRSNEPVEIHGLQSDEDE